MANADDLRARLVEGANALMAAAANEAAGLLQDAAPDRSGDLKRSGYVNQVGDSPRISWVVGFTAPQAQWTEEGVDPHGLGELGTLRHWVDAMTGEDVFRRYTGWEVSMPARPWFHPTLESNWPALVESNVAAAGW